MISHVHDQRDKCHGQGSILESHKRNVVYDKSRLSYEKHERYTKKRFRLFVYDKMIHKKISVKIHHAVAW